MYVGEKKRAVSLSNCFFLIAGHTIISILPEIDCKGLGPDDIPDLLNRTQRIMQEEYERLNVETFAINAKIAPAMMQATTT